MVEIETICNSNMGTFERIQWHVISEPHATLQGVRIPPAILKIVFRHILFIFNAVSALTSGGFRIVSDTLVNSVKHRLLSYQYTRVFYYGTHVFSSVKLKHEVFVQYA